MDKLYMVGRIDGHSTARMPAHVHTDLVAAMSEAERLAQQTGGRFAVLSGLGIVKRLPPPPPPVEWEPITGTQQQPFVGPFATFPNGGAVQAQRRVGEEWGV